jgi:hypothetical protein
MNKNQLFLSIAISFLIAIPVLSQHKNKSEHNILSEKYKHYMLTGKNVSDGNEFKLSDRNTERTYSRNLYSNSNSSNDQYLLIEETNELYFFDPPGINRRSYTYDDKGRNTEELMETEIDDEWQNESKTTRSYSESDQPIELMTSIWENDTWVNSFKTIFTYNADNKVTEQVSYIWQNSDWVPYSIATTVYDNNGYITEGKRGIWNGSSWDLNVQELFTYDTNNNLIEILFTFNGENDFKIEMSYDSNGNIAEESDYYWSEGAWQALSLYANTHDENGNLLSFVESYWGDGWEIYSRFDFTYNEFNNELTSNAFLYEDGTWRNTFRSETTYDENQNNIGHHGEGNYDGEGWWTVIRDTRVYELFITNIERDDDLNPNIFALNQNYPNPFNPETTINFSLPSQSNVVLSIFDITGKEIAVLLNDNFSSGSYNVSFNAESLSSGIYFYKLTADKFVQTRKMMLLK